MQALGGAKNHAVVMPDADLDFAANHLTAAGFGSAGQRCMAIAVAVAVGDAAEPLIERLKDKAEAIKVGPGLEPDSDMGPVVTAQARERIAGYIDSGEAQGADVVVDGRTLEVEGGGFFVGPTLFDGVTPEMDVYRDEIFGPVLAVVRVDDARRGDRADQRQPVRQRHGDLHRSSGQAARHFQRQVQVGMIGINVPIPVPMAFYSFGGWKSSLFGDTHVHGPEGIKFYTRGKVVTSRWPEEARDAPTTAGTCTSRRRSDR